MTMNVDEIIGAFQALVGIGTHNNRVEQAVQAAIPILRRAKELDVELLRRVVEANCIEMEEFLSKEAATATYIMIEARLDMMYLVSKWLDDPGQILTEAKRLGLEVEE